MLRRHRLLGALFPVTEEVYKQTTTNRRYWQRMADICSRRHGANIQSIDVFDNERLDQEVMASGGQSANSNCDGSPPPQNGSPGASRLSALRPYVSGVLPCCVSKNAVTE